jgi:hypothetical protein
MILIAAVPLSAQGGRRGGGGGGFGGGMNLDQLTTDYGLNSRQKSQTDSLIKLFDKNTQATQAWIRNEAQNSATPNADSAKKVADARTAFNASFKSLLNPVQSTKFDSVQTAMCSRRRNGCAGGAL